MIRISQIKIKQDFTDKQALSGAELEKTLAAKAAELLRVPPREILRTQIVRESIDARKKPDVYRVYTADVQTACEEQAWQRLQRSRGKMSGRVQIERVEEVCYRFPPAGSKPQAHRPVIVGTGPAGLFCGYFLALHGYRPILLERGKPVEERQADVAGFWRGGRLLPDSNVQFGEGGAGTFSDGKLNTLVKDKDGRNRAVLRVFADCGAGEEILYRAKPHLGTDVLCGIVTKMREEIIRHGGEVRFNSRVTDIDIGEMPCRSVRGIWINGGEYLPCEELVLAIGHSARDTFSMLEERKVPMEAKAFAVGLRVEHPQDMINLSQYGTEDPGTLGAAPYKLAAKAADGRGVYSFCMCPGGYVVNASSEEGYLAVNGMSYSARDGSNANSAIIVSVTPEDFGSDSALAGVAFQRELERRAYELAGGKIPMQRYGAFKACVEQEKPGTQDIVGGKKAHAADVCAEDVCAADPTVGEFAPQNKGLCAWADVSRILPEACNRAFVEGMEAFGRQLEGFDRPDAILSGVESRTSSPVRICRDDTLQSEVRGLYPCGEGAGYAGGITSAAMDGLRVAEKIAAAYAPEESV